MQQRRTAITEICTHAADGGLVAHEVRPLADIEDVWGGQVSDGSGENISGEDGDSGSRT